MTTISLIQAAVSLGAFALLLITLYGPWQGTCTDVARQVLFEKRDAIFDLARSGKLSFDSPEYGAIRSSLQAQIKFAHNLTLPRFIFLATALKLSGELPQRSSIAQAVDRINQPETRAEVQRLIAQADRAMFLMMFVKSPVMLLLTPLLILALLALRLAHAFKALEQRAATVVQSEAEMAEESSPRRAIA